MICLFHKPKRIGKLNRDCSLEICSKCSGLWLIIDMRWRGGKIVKTKLKRGLESLFFPSDREKAFRLIAKNKKKEKE